MSSGILYGLLLVVAICFMVVSVERVSKWERVAVHTLGKFNGIKGPGLVIIIPIIQTIASRIDTRVQTTKFQSETTLTNDEVAVTIQALLFWRVVNSEMATLQVVQYCLAVELAAQTAMRDTIGKIQLSNLEELDKILKDAIGRKSELWGIEIMSVEIRDVFIHSELHAVMSRGSQTARAKQARITYRQAEAEAAVKYLEAAEIYICS